MRSSSTEIIKVLDDIAYNHSRYEIFSAWVETCYHALRMLPQHAASVFSGGGFVEDDDEAKEAFNRIVERYGVEGYQALGRALALVIKAAHEEPYYDAFGSVYEEWEVTNDATGQFFTPQALCKAMAVTTAEDTANLVRSRLRSALASSPIIRMSEVLGGSVPDTVLEALLVESNERGEEIDFEPVTVYDPACGSARTLLAVAELAPAWMVHRGLILFYGQDIDRDCWMMARANIMLYGMNGHAYCVREQRSGVIEERVEVAAVESSEHGQLVLI